MANLYLVEQGAVLRKRGDRLVVTKKAETLLDVPCHKIDAVLIFGNVHFTTPAVRELFEHGIEMALLTQRGKLLCQLTPPMAKNVPLRLAQYERANDPAFTLEFARTVVAAKVANALALVQQYAYNYRGAGLDAQMVELRRQVRRVASAAGTAELCGVEGTAARTYFDAFGKMLRGDLGFTGRNKRPPRDPVNALLSFGYTLLTNEIASLLDGIGFDPHLGFFHRPDYGRPSLAADLVEEFRAPIADRLTLRLLNNRVLGEADFYVHSGSGGTYLKRESMARYFIAYEELLGEGGSGWDDALPTVPRQQLRGQAHRLAQALTGGPPYEAFRLAESAPRRMEKGESDPGTEATAPTMGRKPSKP